MKVLRNLFFFCALLCGVAAGAQQVDSSALSKAYSERYDLLVSKLGFAGVGIETLLDNWTKVDPDNRKLLEAKYSYYLTKSSTSAVVQKYSKKYLGNQPLFTLKDSTGVDIGYFEETNYDDSLFAISVKFVDQAIARYPNDLSYRFAKAASLIGYEKESPDMALQLLLELVDDFYSSPSREWEYPDTKVDNEFFKGAMQEYCYTFFTIASVSSYEAFRTLAEKMLEYNPKEVIFLSDIGSYYFIALKEYKMALKYYSKVLKIKPDDNTAIRNCALLARKQNNVKMECKYLRMLAEYGDEHEKKAATLRLESLTK